MVSILGSELQTKTTFPLARSETAKRLEGPDQNNYVLCVAFCHSYEGPPELLANAYLRSQKSIGTIGIVEVFMEKLRRKANQLLTICREQERAKYVAERLLMRKLQTGAHCPAALFGAGNC